MRAGLKRRVIVVNVLCQWKVPQLATVNSVANHNVPIDKCWPLIGLPRGSSSPLQYLGASNGLDPHELAGVNHELSPYRLKGYLGRDCSSLGRVECRGLVLFRPVKSCPTLPWTRILLHVVGHGNAPHERHMNRSRSIHFRTGSTKVSFENTTLTGCDSRTQLYPRWRWPNGELLGPIQGQEPSTLHATPPNERHYEKNRPRELVRDPFTSPPILDSFETIPSATNNRSSPLMTPRSFPPLPEPLPTVACSSSPIQSGFAHKRAA